MKKVLFFFLALCFLPVQTAIGGVSDNAVTHYVSSVAELRAALADAESNGEDDVIFVASGTYLLGATLTYSAENGDGILDIEADDPDNPPIFDGSNSDGLMWLGNRNGNDEGADIIVRNLVFRNSPNHGLYIITTDANIGVYNCQFVNNNGGGAYFYAWNGNIELTDLYFYNNAGSSGGGGAYILSSTGNIYLNRLIVANNFAAQGGGGLSIHTDFGTISLYNSVFWDNQSVGESGGGIRLTLDRGTANIVNNTFYNNRAGYSEGQMHTGGAIHAQLYNNNSILNIYNNILWSNSSTFNQGNDIFVRSDQNYDNIGANVNLYNNDFDPGADFDSGQSQVLYITDTDNYNHSGNISEDPKFSDPSNGNFHLNQDSPCIDSGNNNAPGIPETDLDNNSRIFDGDNDGNSMVDMGAYEFGSIPISEPTMFNLSLMISCDSEWAEECGVIFGDVFCEDQDLQESYQIECSDWWCSEPIKEGCSVFLYTETTMGLYQFAGWDGNCTQVGEENSEGLFINEMNDDIWCMAHFEFIIPKNDLTVYIDPEGSGTVEAEELSCTSSNCSGSYPEGQALTLQATPAPGYVFTEWTGDCENCGSNLSCQISMEEDMTCTANFEVGNQPPSMPSNPVPADASTEVDYHQVNFSWQSSDPDNDPIIYNFYFGRMYENECNPTLLASDLVQPSYTLTDLDVKASFCWKVEACDDQGHCTMGPVWSFKTMDLIFYTIEVNIDPTYGGSVVDQLGDINCPDGYCKLGYGEGRQVALKASPASGYEFLNWTGDCSSCGDNDTCRFTMDSDKTCTANFQEVVTGPTPDLVITKIVTPRFWYWGRRARVTVLVENQGDGDITEPFTVSLYATPDEIQIIELGQATIQDLAAGQSKLVRFTFNASDLPDGLCSPNTHHTLHAVADSEDLIAESNEENNEITKNIVMRRCQ